MSAAQTLRSAVLGVPAAALVGAAAAVLGVDVPHAVAVGAGVLALVVVLLAQRSAGPPVPLLPPDPEPPAGGRRDVEQLAQSMVEHRTRIRGIVLGRVRGIAARRFGERGLDPQRPVDAAALEQLVGPAAWAVLRPDRERPVSARELDAALTALERLPPPDALVRGRDPLPDRSPRAD